MNTFTTRQLVEALPESAPDGSDVRPLVRVAGASVAHFTLAAGQVSKPVRHRTIEEIWYVLSGTGALWRQQPMGDSIVPLAPGTCVIIPPETDFQFRATGNESLCVLGITLPPWPGSAEAEACDGVWPA